MSVLEFVGNAAAEHPAMFPAPQLAFPAVLLMWGIGWALHSSTDRCAIANTAAPTPAGPRHLRRGDGHAGWDDHLDQLTGLQPDFADEPAPPPAPPATVARGVVPRRDCGPARHALSDRTPAPRLRPRMANARFAEHIAARSGAGR